MKSDIESWALDYGPLVVISFTLGILVLGKVAHYYLEVKNLMIPPSILSGAFGLLCVGLVSNVEEVLAASLLDGLFMLNSTLVNFCFTALVLGLYTSQSSQNNNKIRSLKMLFNTIMMEGLPMLLYGQIITWGQSAACTFITSFLSTCGMKTPILYGALVPLGLEQGTDFVMEASALNSQTIVTEEAESLGLLVTCITSIAIISCKSILITRGLIDSQGSKYFQQGNGAAEAFSRGNNNLSLMRRTTSMSKLSDGDVSPRDIDGKDESSKIKESAGLGVHLAVMALPSFLSFLMALAYHALQVKYFPFLGLLPGTRLFRVAMVVALLGLVALQRCAPSGVLRFSRDIFMTICGLTLDLIFVTSLARSWPRPHMTSHYEDVSLLVCVCLSVNLCAYLFLGRRYFPNYRFERSLVMSAGSLGNVTCGLFLARVLDPALMSPVPAAYTSNLLLFIIPSTTAKNKIVVNLVTLVGGWAASLVCACFTWIWVVIFTFSASGSTSSGVGIFRGLVGMEDSPSFSSSSSSSRLSSLEIGATGAEAGGEGTTTGGKRKSRRDAKQALTAQTADSRAGSDQDDAEEDEFGDERSALMSSYSPTSAGGAGSSGAGAGAGDTEPAVHLSEPSEILGAVGLASIERWLPLDKRSRRWALRYSLLRDGASLDTLLYTCSGHATGRTSASGSLMAPLGFILLIEDSRSCRFGAYLSHAVEARHSYDAPGGRHTSEGGAGIGSGESFVFTFPHAVDTSGEVFHWTRKNDCFFLANARSGLCIGGGGSSGDYSIQLDDELDFGSSGMSDTYDNPVLASAEYFKCLNVEVYEITEFV